jgi:hypothetical protein
LKKALVILFVIAIFASVKAQESPYFVTYDHHLEEPGNLELEVYTTSGIPRSGQVAYVAPYMEIEYGVTGRWTSELYLEGQGTVGDSAVFTGWRLENRFRPLKREHWINPVFYFEYERTSEASRIQKEIVGAGPDVSSPNSDLQATKNHELEMKLILSGTSHDWNIAGNFITEKSLSASEGFEFGYAVGVARSLATLASGDPCRFCRENFLAGIEVYGGLGSTEDGFSPHNTVHYVAPVVSWQVSDNGSLRFSPSFALTHEGSPVLFRFGYSYEVRGFASKFAQMFGGRR